MAAVALAGEPLPRPSGDVILEVTGLIGRRNTKAGAQFDRAMVEALGSTVLRMSTPWHKGVQEFEGPPLERLLDAVEAEGQVAVMTALNEYRVVVPLKDAEDHGPILALKRNGQYMAVRDNGPIWLIYPLDSDPGLRSHDTYMKMIWQLRHIEIH